ncbi:hypothetical protein G3A_16140 [Bacillus sp. 17376]|uniref:Oxalate/formate antiporter n=1 Tax=Mesobacillus boroniphilus JCM 21738 TaxID=1294265 RepID=W4RPQ6_9BACI|nr:hypothetical protein G3A_16140 [Bacillus sp. 17376]GAE45589.1 hypothetical protein JCM21738_2411 [Mesobacillus boroniphilus JCM 21738]
MYGVRVSLAIKQLRIFREVVTLKKKHPYSRDLLYVHLNERDQYVLSHGMEFHEFARVLSDSLNHLLLLKHRYEDGEFNRHTLFEYVPEDSVEKLVAANVHEYGDFCWIDFEEVEALNVLTAQEIAELLYLGHIKHHLKQPFYNQLDNRFVYLSHEDGWFNKIYYRNFNDFYRMLGTVLSGKLGEMKPEKTLLGIRKKKSYPAVSKEILKSLTPALKEGAVFSLKNIQQNRNRIEMPFWIIGDFANMDDMHDEYKEASRSNPDGRLVFDKKVKEWSLLAQ